MFPESINKTLSLIYDNSDISNNMIITVSCSFPFWDNNTHMNVSITVFIIFALSSIDKYYLQIIFLSHYCFISIIVLVIHIYGILWYRILFWIGISMIWNRTHVPVYSHFVVVSAIHFISLFVPDIDFEFIFILPINVFDVHLQNQSYYCCYSY